MRQIEIEMNNAIRNKRNWRQSNTEVVQCWDGITTNIFLHGNLICRINNHTKQRQFYTGGGWRTATTKSRLNALGANIHQRNYTWYNSDGSTFTEGQAINY